MAGSSAMNLQQHYGVHHFRKQVRTHTIDALQCCSLVCVHVGGWAGLLSLAALQVMRLLRLLCGITDAD